KLFPNSEHEPLQESFGMTTAKPAPAAEAASGSTTEQRKTCFVVMPMSDVEGYAPGHWDRVYEEVFKPACEQAGFHPDRAHTKKGTAIIMADVLLRLHRADMVLCDMSALRPNVMFELGLRQAFDQP